MGKKKLELKFIRLEFIEEGYRLLVRKYNNCSQKLLYICPKGHKHSISWDSWKQGHRCPYCAGQGKLTIEFVRKSFMVEGYILLSDKYINSESKLEYICPLGHEHSMKWNNWNGGKRCPECGIVKQSLQVTGENHYNWKGGITAEPYCQIWLDKEYKEDIKSRDNYECQNPDCWGTSRRLTIHHIDYNKKRCDPWNLITLCNSCNSRANHSRKLHTRFYKNIIKKKYNMKED